MQNILPSSIKNPVHDLDFVSDCNSSSDEDIQPSLNNVTGDSDNNYDYITEAESHTPNDENVTPSFSNREKERLDYKKFHSSGEKVIKVMHS